MNKQKFIKQLRDTAEVLQPLTRVMSPGSATWDGTSYVKGKAERPHASALAWWSILSTIADLIEAQDSPISSKQISYLSRILFGGMGSLNDLSVDSKEVANANEINERLNEVRRHLFEAFRC